jgi:uncharacterized membrane protein YccC
VWSLVRTGWLAETWDRIIGSDPGLTQLRQAGSAVIAMASAIGIEYGFALLTHAGAQAALIAMLLGAIVAMMGSMALTGTGVWRKVGTAVFFPVALGVGMVIGVAVGDRTDLMLGIFVVVMFAAVFVRRFGGAFFFYGFMGWMGYFFAAFLHATVPMLPGLLVNVAIASAWVLLLSITVLRTNPARTLRRVVRAFDARARAVTRACADLLNAFGAQERQRVRLRRRLNARQAGLAEAALMVEGWSAEPGALPPGWHASGLRRRLLDAQHLVEQMAHAATSFTARDGEFALATGRVADRLARRDDRGANLAAYELAEAAEAAGADAAGWWPARHFAAAALEFVALVKQAGKPAPRPASEAFQPAVDLALGLLPGSPAVAADVPARGARWNPLARLDLVSRQAIQVAVAGGLAILLGRELSPTRYYWAVLAAFIMFTGTATRTETFLKGFNRVLGTLIGLLAAIGFAELTAGSTLGVLLVVNASMFFGFYLLTRSYAYMIFFVTIMVGQLYSVFHEFSPGLLVLRLEETALGAAIGFAVALFVTPLSTRDTVRSARDAVLTALADLLRAAADRLDATDRVADLDALSRALDDRMRRLALVARPLTRPLLSNALSPRLRHRLVVYAALTTHARALTVATRAEAAPPSPGPAAACRALAHAVAALVAVPVGQVQPAAAVPLAEADTALFALTPAAPGIRATDPVLRTIAHLHHLVRELTAPGQKPGESTDPVPGELPAVTPS